MLRHLSLQPEQAKHSKHSYRESSESSESSASKCKQVTSGARGSCEMDLAKLAVISYRKCNAIKCHVIILQSGYILCFKSLTWNKFKTRTLGSCIHSEDAAMAIPTSGSNRFFRTSRDGKPIRSLTSPNRSKSRTAIEIQSTKFQKLEKYVPELRTEFKLIPTRVTPNYAHQTSNPHL